uniref:Aminopeptidase O (putative) n=1 Tax=Panthera leo TaxID=9689 RepID=A0A8C8X8F8_PANLE
MDTKLDPSRDDLPLMANTSHILVKHYVLDLDVDFESQIIEGTIVLFFESGNRFQKQSGSTKEPCRSESNEACRFRMPEPCHSPVTDTRTFSSKTRSNDFTICGKGEKDTSGKDGNHDNWEQASGISSSKYCCDTGNHGSEDFLLVLDCCDLSVLKVEEVDVAAVPGIEKLTRSPKLTVVSEELRNQIVCELVTLPADRWREQLDYYARCSQAPGCGELLFDTDTWSLQIRKTGAQTATDFPHAIRIRYSTKPQGRSVTWTSDQSGSVFLHIPTTPVQLTELSRKSFIGWLSQGMWDEPWCGRIFLCVLEGIFQSGNNEVLSIGDWRLHICPVSVLATWPRCKAVHVE